MRIVTMTTVPGMNLLLNILHVLTELNSNSKVRRVEWSIDVLYASQDSVAYIKLITSGIVECIKPRYPKNPNNLQAN